SASSSQQIFFRSSLFCASDIARQQPVFMVVWNNPFGPNPPVLSNPTVQPQCQPLRAATGQSLARLLLSVDARNRTGTFPTLNNVEITPIGHSGTVVFNLATDVQRILTTDNQGHPIARFTITALLQKNRFDTLPYRVRITVVNERGDCTT